MVKKTKLSEDIASIENNTINESIGLIEGLKEVDPDEGIDVSDPVTEAKKEKMKTVRKKLQDVYKEPTEERINPLTGEKVVELKSEVESRRFNEKTKKDAVKYKIIGGIVVGLLFFIYFWLVWNFVKFLI